MVHNLSHLAVAEMMVMANLSTLISETVSSLLRKSNSSSAWDNQVARSMAAWISFSS